MIQRYSRPDFAALWSDGARYELWLEVELAACRAMEAEGLVPAGTADQVAGAVRGRLDAARILEIEARTRISYTWSVPFLDTVVTFTLAPTPSGTRLSLVQSGFKASQKQEFGGARYGWKMMGEKLVDLLARIP